MGQGAGSWKAASALCFLLFTGFYLPCWTKREIKAFSLAGVLPKAGSLSQPLFFPPPSMTTHQVSLPVALWFVPA